MMKKLFREVNLTWKLLIILSILAGIYTAIMAMLPITENTSFRDITVSFEVWIFFGIFIIMNSKSAKDSALKCFVFFLVSQPLVYLIQVPFNPQGWNLFSYYTRWLIWTIATLPMGYIGYYMKKDKWWGLLILAPILAFLGFHYSGFLDLAIHDFPSHLLSAVFCIATMIIYPIFIFENKKIKITGLIISLLIVIATSFIVFGNNTTYNTTVLVSDSDFGVAFDDSYKVYLDDNQFGEVYIEYDDILKTYKVNAEFKKTGKTNFTLEDANGDKTIYEIDIDRTSYDIKKIE